MQCPNNGEILTNSSLYEYLLTSKHSWIPAKQSMNENTYLLFLGSSSQLVVSPMLTSLKLCSSFLLLFFNKIFYSHKLKKEHKVELAWFVKEHSDDHQCDKKYYWLLVASEQLVSYIFPIGDRLFTYWTPWIYKTYMCCGWFQFLRAQHFKILLILNDL